MRFSPSFKHLDHVMCRLLAFALVVLAPTAGQAAGPVCALLNPEQNPQATLLEAKLLADSSATWVERADIDKVLKELKLQAIFSPQGVGDRVRLGKLLKTDLLVMVRPVRGGETPALEVVVSETASGLRFLLRTVPITKNTDADVAELLSATRDGIKRFGEKITEVVAVPPFVSNDFGYEFDHLKGAYAKLAEATVFDRKGVVVVELEEALALAKELALTDPGMKLERSSPLYVFGEYRTEGKGSRATVALQLRAERAGKAVGKKLAVTVKLGEAPGAIQKWVGETLDVGGGVRVPGNSRKEAAVLATRSAEFARLGAWTESLALIEASLLLNPDQPALHVAALRAYTPLIKKHWPSWAVTLAGARAVRPLYLRGLAHFEALTADEDLRHYRVKDATPIVYRFMLAPNGLIADKTTDSKTAEIVGELQLARREVLLRFIPRLAKLTTGTERGAIGWPVGTEGAAISWAVVGLSPKECYALIEQITMQLQDLPFVRSRTVAYAFVSRPHVLTHTKYLVVPEEDAEYRAFLKRLADAKNPEIQAAAVELLRKWEDELAVAKTRRVAIEPVPLTNEGMIFRPIKLMQTGRNQTAPFLDGIRPAGKDTDVLWSGGKLCLMKEKGKYHVVWSSPDAGTLFSDVIFDGQFVWATARRLKKSPLLVVLDPVSEKVCQVMPADGLPQGPDEEPVNGLLDIFAITPLEPGRICAAGSIGRTWIAIVQFDRAVGKVTVKVIHEAKEAQDNTKKDQATRTDVSFIPQWMAAVSGKLEPGGQATLRVVVGRGRGSDTGAINYDVLARPLLLDLDRPSFEVVQGRVPPFPARLDSHWTEPTTDAIYLLSWDSQATPNPALVRIGFPDLKATTLIPALPHGSIGVMIHDGRLHILREVPIKLKPGEPAISAERFPREWWTADMNGKDLRRIAKDVPYIHALGRSSHYGLVCLFIPAGSKTRVLHTIEFPTPSPKK